METVKQIEVMAAVMEIERRSGRIRGGGSADFAEIMAGIAGSGADPQGQRRDRGQACQENDGIPTHGCQSDGAGGDPDRDPGAAPREIARVPKGDHGGGGERDGSGENREKHRNDMALPVVSPQPGAVEDDVRGSPGRSGGLNQRDLGDLVRRLHQSAVAGRDKVRFSSKLEDASEIRFDVRIEGKKVFVTANVRDARTGALLTMSLEELRKRLASCGLELAGFDVAVDKGHREPHRDDISGKDMATPGDPKEDRERARQNGDHALNVIA